MASHGRYTIHCKCLSFSSKTVISFQNINNEFKKFSVKGQVPFIELNGRQIADSNIIIEHLKQEFGKVALALLNIDCAIVPSWPYLSTTYRSRYVMGVNCRPTWSPRRLLIKQSPMHSVPSLRIASPGLFISYQP